MSFLDVLTLCIVIVKLISWICIVDFEFSNLFLLWIVTEAPISVFDGTFDVFVRIFGEIGDPLYIMVIALMLRFENIPWLLIFELTIPIFGEFPFGINACCWDLGNLTCSWDWLLSVLWINEAWIHCFYVVKLENASCSEILGIGLLKCMMI